MKETHQPTDVLGLISNVNSPYTPGMDCANCDPDFDDIEDDEIAELRAGLERHALAHGEVANG